MFLLRASISNVSTSDPKMSMQPSLNLKSFLAVLIILIVPTALLIAYFRNYSAEGGGHEHGSAAASGKDGDMSAKKPDHDMSAMKTGSDKIAVKPAGDKSAVKPGSGEKSAASSGAAKAPMKSARRVRTECFIK